MKQIETHNELIGVFDSKISKVANFLKGRVSDFCVVGSGALLVLGLPLNRSPKDIDLEVICGEGEEELLKALADSQGNNFYKIQEEYGDVKGWEHKPYIFSINGVAVNIWVVKEFTHKTIVIRDNVKYAAILSVLMKKMAYKRAKDYKDLSKIAYNLLTLAE